MNIEWNSQKQSWQKWLPTPGSLLFTLLIAALLYAHQVNAFPASNANSPTQTQTSTTTLPYQGHLTDPNGNPVTATKAMTFRLYNVVSGGTALWQEAWPVVQVSNGLFNVLLGSTTPVTPTLFAENNSLWLGITVGTDTEMTPRVQVGSVPFTFQASRAFGLSAADGDPQDAAYVDANGNVGIGTTNPLTKLHIFGTGWLLLESNGSGGDQNARIGIKQTTNGSDEYWWLSNYTDGSFRIHQNATTDRFTILTNGNVGIGTADPKLKLHLIGTSGLPATSGTTQVGTTRFQVSGYSTVLDFGAEGPATGKQWIQATDAGNLGLTYSLLLNPNGGNIGIGTTSPATPLTVVAGADTWSGSFFGTASSDQVLLGTYAGVATIGANNNNSTAWTNLLINPGGGNVGIGTASPQHKLDVVGDIYASDNICANNGSNCVLSPSDLRLKTNITLLTHPLDKLAQLRGITFDWNDEAAALGLSGDTPHIGVIAQEVEAVFPEIVSTMENGYKAVDYSEFSAVLIEAIKELRAEKDAQIAVLQTEISDLKTQMASGNPTERQVSPSVTLLSGFWFFLGIFVGVGSVCLGFVIAKRQLLAALTSPKTN